MNKKLIIMAMLATLLSPLNVSAGQNNNHWRNNMRDFKNETKEHRMQQKEENQTFRQTLKDMSPEQRHEEMKAHREQQYQENIDFSNGIHEKNINKLRNRLSENTNLSEDEKTAILDKAEERFQENRQERQQQHEATNQYINDIHNDTNMTRKEKQNAIREYQKQQKENNKQRRKQQKAERKSWRKKLQTNM